ncbi:MAG: hypothetical protein HYV07_07225 [Deltaproteobacteria bacterium]|nr:hypothetical protein [Deltaproteobacteria bacterium]
MARITSRNPASTAQAPAKEPTAATAAQAAKLDGEPLFALRDQLYSGDWQTRRITDTPFAKLLGAVEDRFQDLGGEDYERSVRGPKSPNKMDLGEIYKEIWLLDDKKGRLGFTDEPRLGELRAELERVAKAKGFESGNALAMRIRQSLDD